MAALGAVTVLTPTLPGRILIPIGEYVHPLPGSFLGAVTVRSAAPARAALVQPVTDYIVRQLIFIYRQIWPDHGQRFPQ